MQKYKSNITATTGAAIRNVPVAVLTEDGALASIFLDRAGAVPAPNPLTTDSQGVFYFYAVNGRYSLRTTVEGVTITDDDAVLMNDPEELATAGPIAEAVAAAQVAAQQAQDAVEESGIPELVAAAQNAVVDANNAVSQAQAAASLADTAKNESAAAKVAAENAQSGAQSASAQAGQARADAQTAAVAAAASAASVDPAYLLNRENHTGVQAISTVIGLQTAIDAKANGADTSAALGLKADKTAVAQAIAMAQTFTVVPTTFQSMLVFVTQPHFRMFVWNGTKYVRAPWDRPGVLFFSHAPAANVTHGIQVRADVTYNKADHPDLAEILGVSGPTFILPEGRARVLRAADNGRGIDAALVNGYLQDDAIRNIFAEFSASSYAGQASGAFVKSYSGGPTSDGGTGTFNLDTGFSFSADRVVPTASENRVKSLAATLYITR